MVERKGFVVTDSLPHDGALIFGKSQLDIVIYKSNSGYMKGRSVAGAAISVDPEGACEVIGVTLEMKRSVMHLKFMLPCTASTGMH